MAAPSPETIIATAREQLPKIADKEDRLAALTSKNVERRIDQTAKLRDLIPQKSLSVEDKIAISALLQTKRGDEEEVSQNETFLTSLYETVVAHQGQSIAWFAALDRGVRLGNAHRRGYHHFNLGILKSDSGINLSSSGQPVIPVAQYVSILTEKPKTDSPVLNADIYRLDRPRFIEQGAEVIVDLKNKTPIIIGNTAVGDFVSGQPEDTRDYLMGAKAMLTQL